MNQLQENLLLVSLRSRFNISLVASVAQTSTGQHLRTSPVDGRPLGTIASASAADIDAAAQAAGDAFEEWSRTPGKERKRILHCT